MSYSRMESRFDTSSPYNREVVLRDMEILSTSSVITTTNNFTADVSVIDAMLSVLSSPPIPTTSSPGKGLVGIAGGNDVIEDADNLPPSAGAIKTGYRMVYIYICFQRM